MLVTIRWLIRRDMPEVLDIEWLCFEFPWTEDEFLWCLRQRNCIGMVAEAEDGSIAGFMLYELHKNRLAILNFAVAAKHQGKGVGRQMVEKLIHKIQQQRRNEIIVETRERNTDAHLFFSAMGFRATAVLRDHYEDTDEDCYVFMYKLPRDSQWRNEYAVEVGGE